MDLGFSTENFLLTLVTLTPNFNSNDLIHQAKGETKLVVAETEEGSVREEVGKKEKISDLSFDRSQISDVAFDRPQISEVSFDMLHSLQWAGWP